VELAAQQTRNVHFQVGGMLAFVEFRLALHFGGSQAAEALIADLPIGGQTWWQVRHWYLDAYPWTAAAEYAAAMGRHDATERILTAGPAAGENAWAAGLLARARARHSGDSAHLDMALTIFETLGARFERACTLALIPQRYAEARSELDDLSVVPPTSSHRG
jgi:hypothetical protein